MAARETAIKTAKEKIKVADTAEKKAATAEKARALAEKRSAELLAKQNETDMKLAEAISLNAAQAEELADLRAALEACEEKWYNEGFTDTENYVELVVNWLGGWDSRPVGLLPYRPRGSLKILL